MISESNTPRSKLSAARTPFRILISSNIKNTGPINTLSINPVTTALTISSNNVFLLSLYKYNKLTQFSEVILNMAKNRQYKPHLIISGRRVYQMNALKNNQVMCETGMKSLHLHVAQV